MSNTIIAAIVPTPAIAAQGHTVPAPKAVVKSAPIGASLLETVRALDGNKADRAAVAYTALMSAYTVALTYGNKTQLNDVLTSTGKKVCEKAMRNAVQVVGVLGLHKTAATRQEAIEQAVMVALDLFIAVACVTKEKTVKAKVEAPAPVVPVEGAGDSDTATEEQAVIGPIAAATLNADTIQAYAATLDDSALTMLTNRLLALVESRATPLLKAA